MESPKKILLVQLYSNGDCLYATAVARQVKHDFPGCALTWAIADFCRDIIAGNPFVDNVVIVHEVKKDDVTAFRKLRQKFYKEKKAGTWDEVFITQNMDSNLANYDGTIRGMIFSAYPNPITVPVQPVLELSSEEKNNVANFAGKNKLSSFKNIILWEYAPQSGQSVLHVDFVMQLAQRIIQLPSTAIILSSATRFSSTEKIIDASVLSLRENAALTHYCNLLIGCSSGITWISTCSSAKQLPMVQLLNPTAVFLNAPSVDFARYGIDATQLMEITHINEETVYQCIRTIQENNFAEAKKQFNEVLPVQFNTTRIIVYNLLCYLQFGAIARHCLINMAMYGRRWSFFKQLLLGIVTFPFKLIGNIWRKRIYRM